MLRRANFHSAPNLRDQAPAARHGRARRAGRAGGRRLAKFAAVAAALVALPLAAQAGKRNRLDRRIEAILRQSPGRQGFWGVEAVQLPGGKPLCLLHAEHLFQPASNLKLFTLAAALEKLGPDFTFLTTVETAHPPDAEGRVGNLYIVGRGDANFATSRELPYAGPNTPRNTAASLQAVEDLANQVAGRGVREVAGNLIADDSYFVDEPYPSDWAVGDLVWGYGAPVTALTFNDNLLLLHIQPAAEAGEKAQVWLDPVGDYYRIKNDLETAAAGAKSDFQIERGPGSMTLQVFGRVPAGAPVPDQTVAIQDPARLIAELLRRDLEEKGIEVEGNIEVHHLTPEEALEEATHRSPAAASPSRVVLAEHRSPPLAEDVTLTAKVSQNLHAEMLLLTMGHEFEQVGSRKAGLKVLAAWTEQAGIPADEMRMADGSGLSREDLVAPDAIVRLLEFMARSPHFRTFFDALPVAGADGTLADRFKGTPAAGRIHAKTGSIEHVDSLSGYMGLPNGKRVAFSIIGNADPLRHTSAEAVADRIALEIFEEASGGEKRER
jgi:D-alanyl-D-alanine carboxypeptidase/D-alanyl-D-alanine-endopeptidase (penicillin-binding protein 4)